MNIFSSFKKTVPTFAERKSSSSVEAFSEQEQKFLDVCSLQPDQALEALSSSEQGLTIAQAEEHLITWGPNDLGKKKHQGFFKEILIRCKNPLVIQLLVICVASILMGDAPSATIVGFMVILSVGFSYCQEHRSSKAVDKLRAMVQTNCHVLRDGHEVDIPMSQIVPGDIVSLQAGSLIAADIRLIAAKDFFVSQSSLTGESMPVEKSVEAGVTAENKKRTIIELPNAVFQGSNVVSGSAKGLVVNTGINTHFGAITQ